MISFICNCCGISRPMDRASKRMRDGRKKNDRCLDCEADAQRKNRLSRGPEINQKRRENYPKHRAKQKDTMLRKAYGIGVNQWEDLFNLQGRVCSICSTTKPKGRGWQTDHDHKTGQVRSILCHSCNSLLGHAKESPEILLSAFRYLYAHGGGPELYFNKHFSRSSTHAQ